MNSLSQLYNLSSILYKNTHMLLIIIKINIIKLIIMIY